METKNAIIESTMLGFEDHGIFTCWITLDYGGGAQGFGGRCLGGDYTDRFIKGILKTLEVNSWEDLKGTYVRVKCTNGKVSEIGQILKDKWFNPEDLKGLEFKEKKDD